MESVFTLRQKTRGLYCILVNSPSFEIALLYRSMAGNTQQTIRTHLFLSAELVPGPRSLAVVVACNIMLTPHVPSRLIDLKNIFAKQLPNMPKEYIVRLIFDHRHRSLLALKARRLASP